MSPLPHRRARSTAEEVERLLAKVKVNRRMESGGTILTEPVIVARGKRLGRLELLDQNGRQLGFANPGEQRFRGDRSYELCDTRPAMRAGRTRTRA